MNVIIRSVYMFIVACISFTTLSFSTNNPFEVLMLGSLLSAAGLLVYFALFEDKVVGRLYLNNYMKFYYAFENRNKLPRPSITLTSDLFDVFMNVCMLKDYNHYKRSYDSDDEFHDDMTLPLKRMIKDIRYINDIPFKTFVQEVGLYPSVLIESAEISYRRYKFFYDNVQSSELKQELELIIGPQSIKEVKQLENNSVSIPVNKTILNHVEEDII